MQEHARAHPLGIPVTISTDPRHSFANNPGTAIMAGPFSQWPEPLGFGAMDDPELVERFADTVRREYLAVGIRIALHPQIDLATEPAVGARQRHLRLRTRRSPAALGVAYVRRVCRASSSAPESVSAMAKHFPGGGPQQDGEDPHFAYGREQVYPGGKFDLHLQPFRDVIAAGVSQMMPYYGMPIGHRATKRSASPSTRRSSPPCCANARLRRDRLHRLGHPVRHLLGRRTPHLRRADGQGTGRRHRPVRWRVPPRILIGLVRDGRSPSHRLDASVRRLLRRSSSSACSTTRSSTPNAADAWSAPPKPAKQASPPSLPPTRC